MLVVGEYVRHAERGERVRVDAMIAQPAVDLRDGVPGVEAHCYRESLADRGDGEHRDDAVGQRAPAGATSSPTRSSTNW